MKSVFLSVLNIRVLLTSCVLLLCVQQSKGIAVVGEICTQQGLVEGAAIHTILDGRRLDVHMVNHQGKYKIELEYNRKYELIFALKGTFSQKIVVETIVPETILKSNQQFQPLTLDVNLYPKIPGVQLSFVENPVRKIYYNPIINNFSSEIYQDDNQIAKQIEQAVYHSRVIKSETDFLSKLTRFELAEMKREYNKILARAGKVSDEVPVLTAFNGNVTSTRFFSNESIYSNQYDDINELLGAIILTAEIDKENAERYDDFILEADNLFYQEKYTSARISYNRILSINPDDDYAQIQCELIDDLLEKQVELEQYKYILAHADNSFNELLFNEAAKHYRSALQIKPDEQYLKSRLERINYILEKESEEAERSTGYKQTLKEGEAMYQKQFYEKSLASYMNALNLEPGDLYASRKVLEIKIEMTTLADRLMYDKLIVSANKLYKKEQYREAMLEYFAASELNPDNQYALIQINAINKKLILEEKFADFIYFADNQFEAENYKESKENYLEALKINSKDKYSKNKIKEIDVILKEKDDAEKYYASLALVEKNSNNDESENINIKLAGASNIEYGETYPAEKSEKIDNSISERTTLESEKRNGSAVVAVSFVKEQPLTTERDNNANNSLAANVRTGNIDKNPNETTVSNSVLEVRGVENEAELINIYNRYIKEADELYSAGKYIDSRKWYYMAWDMKPDEKRPKLRIDNINRLLKETPMSQLDKEYYYFVDLADSTFRSNQYAVARGWYNRALTIKANERYPKEQLNEIEKKIAERMAAQSGEQFEINIQKAAKAIEAENYNVARFWYKKALELQPGNIEVKNRLLKLEQDLN